LNPVAGNGWELGDQLTTNVTAFQPSLSMNSLSEAVVAFMAFDGTYIDVFVSETGTSGIHSGPEWNGNLQISTSGTHAGYPAIASTFDSDLGVMCATAVWLSTDGTNVYVQAASGSKTPIQPPTSLGVIQNSNVFGILTQYYNTISWEASASPGGEINGYAIYRNGQLFDVVSGSPPSLNDYNAATVGTVVYGVTTIDNNFLESTISEITYP